MVKDDNPAHIAILKNTVFWPEALNDGSTPIWNVTEARTNRPDGGATATKSMKLLLKCLSQTQLSYIMGILESRWTKHTWRIWSIGKILGYFGFFNITYFCKQSFSPNRTQTSTEKLNIKRANINNYIYRKQNDSFLISTQHRKGTPKRLRGGGHFYYFFFFYQTQNTHVWAESEVTWKQSQS